MVETMKERFLNLENEKQIEMLTIKPNASLTPVLENCFNADFISIANNYIFYLAYENKYRQTKAKILKLQAIQQEKLLAGNDLTESQREDLEDLQEILSVYEKEFLAKYDNSNPFADDEKATYICKVCASYISKVWTVVNGVQELYKLGAVCHKENIDVLNGKNPHFKAVYTQLESIANTLTTESTQYLQKRHYNVSSTETKFFIGTMVVIKPDKAKNINLQLKSEKAFRNDVITCLYGKLQGQKLDTITGLKSE